MSDTIQSDKISSKDMLTVTLDYNPRREEIFTRLKSRGSFPEELITTLAPKQRPITIKSNPAGIRWIYDKLVEISSEFEQKEEEYMYMLSHETADIIYQKVKNEITIPCKTSPL